MTEEQLEHLLDTYGLDELLERAGIETIEVLSLLDELGYLRDLDLPEPL